ncbi:MAG: Na+/H+ antiporter NhaA [Solirubrobacteraceae bacterium]
MPEPSATPERRFTPWDEHVSRSLRDFLRTETGSAGLLLAATIIALVWANSPAGDAYDDLWSTHLVVSVGGQAIDESLRHWVNDGLMAFFFYVVALEIRRELELGELRDRRAAAIPALAALAGMVVPALVFLAVNVGGEGARGWGIVMATDIAFVLGALALLGDRVPAGVRVFLLTLAIVDDVGAIAVIAVFYSDTVELTWLAAAAGILLLIWVLRRFGPPWRGPMYLAAGVPLWIATLESGIHPTIAGVALGLMTTVHPPQRVDVERAASLTRLFRREPSSASGRAAILEIGSAVSPNERFQAAIHPWTSYLVIPLFALANAGVPLGGDALSGALTSPVTLGVVAGLVLGKTLGIGLFTLAAVRWRLGPLPQGMGPRHVLPAAALAGIGFTVSLFVAELAYADQVMRDEAKVGVLVASVVAAIVGLVGLRRAGGPVTVEEPSAAAARLDQPVDPVHDQILGPPTAAHTLVLYVDYACPHSRALAPTLESLMERSHGRLRLAVRQLPNDVAHPGTTLAAQAALAAAAQGRFWPMHRRMLAHPVGDDLGPADLLAAAREVGIDPDRIAEDLRHQVRRAAVGHDIGGAHRSGVPGTPTLFLDGRRLDLPYTRERLEAEVAHADGTGA